MECRSDNSPLSLPHRPVSHTRHTIRQNLETKDLGAAIDCCLRIWNQVQADDATQVKLHVITSHSVPVELLATTVPPETRGFSPLGSSHNLTAHEARDLLCGADNPRDWSIDLNLCAIVGRLKTSELLSRLRHMLPDPLRRCAVSLYVENIRWPGTPATSAGGFVLDDAKHFGRKIRFSIRAYVDWDGATRAEIARALAPIGESRAPNLSAAKKVRVSLPSSSVDGQRAEVCLLFDHCIESVGAEMLNRGFDWTTLAGVFPDGAGVHRRFEAIASGRASDFRWDSVVSQFVRAEYPTFKKVAGVIDDALTFLSPLRDGWSLALVFDKHPGLRVGRVFKLRCGVVLRNETTVTFTRTAPVLRCSGGVYSQHSDFCPEFTFNTMEELDQVLASLRSFLGDFLRRFTRQIEETFLPGLAALERVLPVQGALTCDEALALARDHLRTWGVQVGELWRITLTGTVDSLHYRQDAHAQCPADGRLTKQHAWEFAFSSGQSGVSVTVPWAGTIRQSTIWPKMWGVWSENDPPIPTTFGFNSPAIAATAWRVKEHLARRYPGMSPVVGLPRLAGRRWLVQIEFSGSPPTLGWVRIETEIDAATAQPLAITFDERFPDRPEGTVQFVERGPFPFS